MVLMGTPRVVLLQLTGSLSDPAPLRLIWPLIIQSHPCLGTKAQLVPIVILILLHGLSNTIAKVKNSIRTPNFGGIVSLDQPLPPVTKIRLKVTHFYWQSVPFYDSWVNSDLAVELKHQSWQTRDDAQEKELHLHKKLFSGFLHHLTSVDVF